MPVIDINITTNPTQSDFSLCEEREVALFSPRGEGKSEGGIIAMTVHAQKHPKEVRPVQWAMVRDTFANHRLHSIRDFRRSQVGRGLQFRNQDHEVVMPGFWECYLIGVDQPMDMEKLRGVWGGLWFEEPAPASGVPEIGMGIGEEAWELGMTGLRQPGVTPRAQITSNYPDEDHWVWRRFVTDLKAHTRFFEIPKGENSHLPPGYRELLASTFRENTGMYRRLVEGLPGFVELGEAVTPEFNEKKHVSSFRLEPMRGIELAIGWDFGHHPSAIIGQIAPSGQLRIYDAQVGANIGMEQLIDSIVGPLLDGKYRGLPLRHVGGHEGFIREQTNSEQTAVRSITTKLGGGYTPGPVSWPERRDAMRSIFNRNVGKFGEAVVMDPSGAASLIRALRGAWHYKKTPDGSVLRDIPVKNRHSHPGDAFAALVAVLFGVGNIHRARTEIKSIRTPGYTSGGDRSAVIVPIFPGVVRLRDA